MFFYDKASSSRTNTATGAAATPPEAAGRRPAAAGRNAAAAVKSTAGAEAAAWTGTSTACRAPPTRPTFRAPFQSWSPAQSAPRSTPAALRLRLLHGYHRDGASRCLDHDRSHGHRRGLVPGVVARRVFEPGVYRCWR